MADTAFVPPFPKLVMGATAAMAFGSLLVAIGGFIADSQLPPLDGVALDYTDGDGQTTVILTKRGAVSLCTHIMVNLALFGRR